MPAPYDQASIPPRRQQVSLDSPPPAPVPRKRPGDDTSSLLGGPNVNVAGGASMGSPTGKILSAIAAMMEAVNLIDSVSPGLLDTLPPAPFKQQVALLMDKGPEVAQMLSQSQGFGGLTATIGPLGALGGGAMGPAAAMGQPASPPQPPTPTGMY